MSVAEPVGLVTLYGRTEGEVEEIVTGGSKTTLSLVQGGEGREKKGPEGTDDIATLY